MSLPYFPMYPTDFEAKTSHLSLEEDGAYNRLLRLMWMTPGCSLPDDDSWIMRRMRCDADTYERVVRVVIDEFCIRENGRVSNAKLMRVFEESNDRHQRRISAGSKGGKAKALKNKETASSNAVAKTKQPEPEPEPDKREEDKSSSSDDVVRACSMFSAMAERHGWSVPRKVTKARKSAVRSRLKDCGGLDGWQEALDRAAASDFLSGRTPQGYKLGLDFFVRDASFTKLFEGFYDNRSSQLSAINGGQHGTRPSAATGRLEARLAGARAVVGRER